MHCLLWEQTTGIHLKPEGNRKSAGNYTERETEFITELLVGHAHLLLKVIILFNHFIMYAGDIIIFTIRRINYYI